MKLAAALILAPLTVPAATLPKCPEGTVATIVTRDVCRTKPLLQDCEPRGFVECVSVEKRS